MMALVGLLAVLVTMILLVTGRLAPMVTFVVIPLAAAFAVGLDLAAIQKLVGGGMATVAPMVALFIFAILFFSIMNEQGLFEPVIRAVLRFAGDQPYLVLMASVIVAVISHLDGAGATTYVVTITAFLPIYKRLNIDVRHLPMLVGMAAGIMNMEPWTPAAVRAASVIKIDPVVLWRPLGFVQLFGIVVCLVLAWWLGRRIPVVASAAGDIPAETAVAASDKVVPRWRYAFNACLTLAVIVVMLVGILTPVLVLMIGVAFALAVNYRGASAQLATVKRNSSEALLLAAVLLSAGVFLGILNGSGMLDAIAHAVLDVMPASLGAILHIIVGFFALPLGMMFGADPYYFGIAPILITISGTHGIAPETVIRAMMIGENVGFAVSPVVASAYLAAGLAGVEFGQHIRHSLAYTWGVAILMLVFAIAIGAV